MTKDKAQKRAVRERMAKTGERYTTARHYLLDLHHAEPPADAEPSAGAHEAIAAPPAHPDLTATNGRHDDAMPSASRHDDTGRAEPTEPAAPAAWIEQPGMSDEAIQRNTGKTWNEWFALLDAWGAAGRTHAAIARYLNETYNPGGWWAQGLTVGYERARGLRRRHEHADGFAISVSKTVAVPVERLFAAFVDEASRDQWLEPGALRPRTSQPNRSARFDVTDTDTLLTAYFQAKGEAKSSVQLEESKLPAADLLEARKALWKARLAQLAAWLSA